MDYKLHFGQFQVQSTDNLEGFLNWLFSHQKEPYDNDDIDIELYQTTSLGFALAQFRLFFYLLSSLSVSYSIGNFVSYLLTLLQLK